LKQVLAGKGVERSYLGLRYVTLTPDVAKQYKVSVTQGAYIVGAEGRPGVLPGSPADKAGLREKDIIKKVNNMTVGPQGGVSSLIGEYAPGDTVSLLVLRDGRELTLKATLEAYRD
jgi:S1-C subfamily serine protease